MKLILNQIKMRAHDQPFKIDQEVDVSELVTMDNEIRDISPVRVQGDCTVDGDNYVFSLQLTGEMVLPCARTLVDVTHPFAIDALEIFTISPYLTEEDRENEVQPIQGEILDLRPALLENILLAIPFRVFTTDEEVLNTILSKGDGWEYTLEADQEQDHEEEQEKTIDPRLQKLQSLLDDKREEK